MARNAESALWLLLVFVVSAGAAAQSSTADQVIDDPELAGVAHVDQQRAPESSDAALAPPGSGSEARLVLHSRFGFDLAHDDPREEVWESTNMAMLETRVKPSETLRIEVGIRARYHAASLAEPVVDAGARRLDLDVTPTAGFVDIAVADGLHLQLGYQPVQLGRFDFVSASDVLSVFDLRDGLATLPDAYQVAQLAARADYDPVDWLSLRVLYVPFFTPHLIPLVESDYGVARQDQAAVEMAADALQITDRLAAYWSRADRERLAQTALATFTPVADISAQQAAVRATMRGSLGELSLTAATAVEHLPALHFTPEAIDALGDPTSAEAAARVAGVARPVWVDYGRFGLLAVDGVTEVSQMSLAIEAAYMLNRTLYTLGAGPYPATLVLPDTSDMLQLGAKIEYVAGAEWLLTAESFVAYAMRGPKDQSRDWLLLTAGRYLAGIAALGVCSPGSGFTLTLGVLALTGPSLFLAPSVGYEVLPGLEIELGAVIVEGPDARGIAAPSIALGTLWDATDHAFVGLRYSL